MTYEETVDLIQGICETINPSGTFIHGRRVDGSLSYDKPMPQIHLYPFITSPDLENSIDSSAINMGFWIKSGAEMSMEESKKYITESDVLCRSFVNTLYETSGVDLSQVRMEPQYNVFNAVLTGYALTFVIKTRRSSC